MATWRAPVTLGSSLRSPRSYLTQSPFVSSNYSHSSSHASVKWSMVKLRCAQSELQTTSSQVEQPSITDSVLPDDLQGSIRQSAESTTEFLLAGGKRGIIELALDELQNMDLDGGQQQLWDCSRLFLDFLQEGFPDKQFKAVFPDAGAAALLKYQWTDASFKFGSLSDRRPVSEDDDIIVLVSPDYQMISEVQKLAFSLLDKDYQQEKPLVMWNPKLYSGDVGVGLSIRRMRTEFLSTFTTIYSLKSYPMGAIFKRHPGLWQIFMENKEMPGRFTFAKEQAVKPGEDDLERILFGGDSADDAAPGTGGGGGGGSFIGNAMASLSSFGRFMRSLSN